MEAAPVFRPAQEKKGVLIGLPAGWKKGFEPSTFGTTIRHSNQLSYIHHIDPSKRMYHATPRIGVQM